MKKTLLSIGFIALSLAASAQTTSFEASEGWVLGPADDQVGWNISTASPASGAIVDTYATDGTQSLAIIGTGNMAANLLGAFSPITIFNDDVVTMSFDIYLSELSDTASDFYIGSQSPSQQFSTSRIRFTYEGTVQYLGYTTGTTVGYVTAPNVTVEAGQWYHVDMVHYFVDAQPRVEMLLNGDLIITAPIYGGTNIEQLTFLNDDFESTAYIDNIVVGAGNLGVNPVAKAKFNVFPNPANDVVNVATEGTFQTVSVSDINGRVVKNFTLDTQDSAQLNISDLTPGVYMLNITSDLGSEVKKIVKK